MHAFPVPGVGASLCYYDLPGERPALIFLHGLGAASSEAFPVLARHPRLAAHRALLVDLLGFGYADRPERFGYTLEEHADSVAALLDHLALTGCWVVGHSMGGDIAVLLATRRPELVDALVDAEGSLDPALEAGGRGRRASVRVSAYSEDEYVRVGHRALLQEAEARSVDNPAMGGHLRAVQRAAPHAVHRCAAAIDADRQPTFRLMLEALSVPRTYLAGTRSLPLGASAVPGRYNGVNLAFVADAGHLMYLDNPEGFARAVADAFGAV